MAQVTGSDLSLVELNDAALKILRAIRNAQNSYGGTLRGSAFQQGEYSPISSWAESNTNGGQLQVTLTLPTTHADTADGYSVSVDAEFDDGV